MQQEVSTDSDELTFGSYYKRARKGTDVNGVRAMPLAKTHNEESTAWHYSAHSDIFVFRYGLALDAR